jgi:sugar lactone lactonase YvrE
MRHPRLAFATSCLITWFLLCIGLASCGGGNDGAAITSISPTEKTAAVTKQPNQKNTGLFLVAGSIGGPGWLDGTGATARFWSPASIAADPAGNLYVADEANHTIRKITPAGVVTTLAGTAGVIGSADGSGAAAQFADPRGIAADPAGNLYVADPANNTIRKITPAGVVTTLAGTAGVTGHADGSGAAAQFNVPSGIAADRAGNLYVADTFNNTIRKITATGVVTTLAGTAGVTGSADGSGAAAQFSFPFGIALDPAGNLYVADTFNHTIRKITATGVVTTLAGTAGVRGSADGSGAAAQFSFPQGIAADAVGNLYVADEGNGTIRKITPAGVVTTLAGTAGVIGSADGSGAAAQFNAPAGIAADPAGNLYVTDSANNTIRKIAAAGVVTTLAGTAGVTGSADGSGAAALFAGPAGIAADSAGNLYVADAGNDTIRKITPAGVVTTLAGTAGVTGSADGSGAAAQFYDPAGIAADPAGNLYVADAANYTIRKITAAGVVTTLAGTARVIGHADGSGAAAQFNVPWGIAADRAGNLYVADSNNGTIRKITATGVVTTLAGTVGVIGHADGSGAAAQFNSPESIAADPAGNLYVADTFNHTIRKITAAGVVTTVAGVANQHGIQLGCLPGSLSYPFGVTLADTNSLALTSANSVLNLVVPSPEGLGGVGRADQKTAAVECGDRGDGHQEGPHGPGDIGE